MPALLVFVFARALSVMDSDEMFLMRDDMNLADIYRRNKRLTELRIYRLRGRV